MLSLVFSTIAFFVASYFIKRYLDETGVPKTVVRGLVVFVLALEWPTASPSSSIGLPVWRDRQTRHARGRRCYDGGAMKIVAIDSFVLTVPTSEPMARNYAQQKLVVAEISTDEGVKGLGYSLVFGGGGAAALQALGRGDRQGARVRQRRLVEVQRARADRRS